MEVGMDPRRKSFEESSIALHAFFKRVGKVWKYDELRFLDLDPHMLTGQFWCDRVQSLIDFCESNKEYHIISSVDGKVYNKFVPKACHYYLADGDADPKLVFELWSGLDVQDVLQVGYAVFAPIVGTIKSGNDT